ncbi:hypothetical protein DMUE_1290 [Dictyocoela muelleri]|nr:hypothetical protein DMUE_1290 [Dictyocoela muelleri]
MCKKQNQIKTYGYTHGVARSDTPFKFISNDILGPIKLSHFKSFKKFIYFYLLTITDIFSRFTMTYPILNLKSQSVQKNKNLCTNFGFTAKILTDQGRQYIAKKI